MATSIRQVILLMLVSFLGITIGKTSELSDNGGVQKGRVLSRLFLLQKKQVMFNNRALWILPASTVTTVLSLKIQKKRRRGKKAGRRHKFNPVTMTTNVNNLQPEESKWIKFGFLNARSVKNKD